MKLIDIEGERKTRRAEAKGKKSAVNGPDSDMRVIGPDGRTYYKFSVTYQYQRKLWTFDIWAASMKDAHKRVCDIKHFPVDIHQIYSEVAL